MTTKSSMLLQFGCALALLCNSGCATRYHVKSTLTEGYVTSEAARNEALAHPPADLKRLRVTRDGAPFTADQAAVEHYLNALEDAGLFSRVTYRVDANPDPKVVLVTLEFAQKERPHLGRNLTKAFFIGFTFFILTPVLPMTYAFDSEMKATIRFANGEEVVCRRVTRGKCSYPFIQPPQMAMEGTRAKVLEENCKVLTADFLRSLPAHKPELKLEAGK